MTARRVIVEADGGSRGNPGPAGYGALVRDAETGEVLREAAEGIGVASNNVAEYRGLIAGLEAALDLGADDVEVRMDSKLVVEQMSSRWKVKHPDMKVLAGEAAVLLRQLPEVRFTHVRRELNAAADRLANQAMDDQAAGRAWRRRDAAEPDAASAASTARDGWSASRGPATVAMLLRHGQTALSDERRFSGRHDVPLTDLGEAQAAAAARRLSDRGVDVIVSSPLRRARQTATIVAAALDLDVTTDDGFAELDFGEWEGSSFAELTERDPDRLHAWVGDPTVTPPGGESIAAAAGRVAAARDRVVASYPDSRVLVVSHVTPIKLLVSDALAAPLKAVFRLHLDVASLSVLDWYATAPAVVRLVNDTGHLSEMAPPAAR